MDLRCPLRPYHRAVTSATKPAAAATAHAVGPTPPAGRRLRADAERNRARILEAAHRVFAERGLDATLHDVAEAAGLGVGTVYRRFPDKEALVEALFESELERLAQIAERAVEAPDAWAALTDFMRTIGAEQAANRGLHDVLHNSAYGQAHVTTARNRIMPTIARLLERAQEQGAARQDIEPTDLAVVILMVSSMAQCTQELNPDAWIRYLQLLLDSLRALPGQTPLTEHALDEVDLTYAMANWKDRR
jgi:AcrR family transcriptional regulator